MNKTTNKTLTEQVFADPDQYLTSTELAFKLKCSKETIESWRKKRIIIPIKLGRLNRWYLPQVLQELSQWGKTIEKP